MKTIIRFSIIVFYFYLLFLPILARSTFQQLSAKNNWQKDCQKSLTLVRENNLAEAEILLRQLLEDHHDIPQIHYALGLLFNKKEPGCREAEKYFEKAIDLDQNFAEAWFRLGMVYLNQKNRLLKVRQDFYKAVRIKPDFTEAWFRLGEVESELNQTGAAIEAYSKAVLANPENEKMYQTFLDFAHWQKAEKICLNTIERLIQRFPANFKYLLEKARRPAL